MTTTFNWTIAQLDRQISDGYVLAAHWRVSAIDGGYNSQAYGVCSWSGGEPSVAFEDLDEATVLAWVWESVNKDDTEADLLSQIEAQKNPVKASGLPWAQGA